MSEEEKKELVKEEKKNSKKDGERTLFGKIVNVILWIVVLGWMALCIVDFVKVQNLKDPIFCLKKSEIKHDDGKVRVCTGLGYKVYNYERKCYKALQFGPFWAKDASETYEGCVK